MPPSVTLLSASQGDAGCKLVSLFKNVLLMP